MSRVIIIIRIIINFVNKSLGFKELFFYPSLFWHFLSSLDFFLLFTSNLDSKFFCSNLKWIPEVEVRKLYWKTLNLLRSFQSYKRFADSDFVANLWRWKTQLKYLNPGQEIWVSTRAGNPSHKPLRDLGTRTSLFSKCLIFQCF